jgi:hypothetical protein
MLVKGGRSARAASRGWVAGCAACLRMPARGLSSGGLDGDALRAELRSVVRDPDSRAAVTALLEKAKEKSWDLAHALQDATVRDPFKMVEDEIAAMNRGIFELVSNKHPLLEVMARYYFQVSTMGAAAAAQPRAAGAGQTVSPDCRAAGGPGVSGERAAQCAPRAAGRDHRNDSHRYWDTQRGGGEGGGVWVAGVRACAQATAASLAHDDVLDEASFRRGHPSLNAAHGNKVCAALTASDYAHL